MKISFKFLLLCVVTSAFFFSCKKNDSTNQETLNTQDQNFIVQAEMYNSAEIRAAQIADTTTDSAVIKSFAQKLVSDQQAAQSDLQTLGMQVNVAVSDTIGADQTLMLDSLRGLTGRAFDSTFIMNQIQDHNQVIAEYQAEVNAGNKSSVINYANKYLPTLQMHLNAADSIATAMHFK